MVSQSPENTQFNKIRDALIYADPVSWSERYLTLDGRPFRLVEAGYKPLVDIFRYIGIKSLDKDSKPLVWVKGRQVAGTTTAAAMTMYFMGSGLFGNGINPPIRVAHCWPTLDRAAAYSKTKLSSMIDASIIEDISVDPNVPKGKGKKAQGKPYMRRKIDTTSPANDNIQFKQFEGGNHLWIESCGLDGSRMRGKTLDVFLGDEIQEIPAAAIGNSLKTLTKAQYGALGDGIQMFFGTPQQRGSDYWKMWQQSNQQYYYLGCDECEDVFPLYTPDSNSWESVWIHSNVVKCTHCGREQDRLGAINRGKWVATKDSNEAKFVGFHLNQLYLPEFTKEKIIAMKPENSAINTERTYQNEVLGEFFSGEAGIITPDEIREKCGDPERKFRGIVSPSEEIITFLGVDIGAKADIEQLANSDKVRAQGQSYSTAVVLSMAPGGKLIIEFATKFKRNDLASKKAILDELIKKYRCKLTVCDLGYAHDFHEIMQTEYGDRFLASESLGKVNEKARYRSDTFPRVIQVERDHWIMEMYERLRAGMIRFPLGSYEQIAWLMQHCSNMEIKPSVSRHGEVHPHYVKTGPNDGFSALINAYVAYKFFISAGFTIKNPLLQHNEFSKPGKKKPSVISVYSER